jgi:redox-sensing transcriptional repressor
MKKKTTDKKVPQTTVYRMSLYYRALKQMLANGIATTSSASLSETVGFTDAQIRKDLAYFGQFGVPGRGYGVENLLAAIAGVLGINKRWKVALVGVGHLGYALLAYKGFKDQGFDICCAFDNDPDKVGKTWEAVRIHDIADAPDVLRENRIELGVIAIPEAGAQYALDVLVEGGVSSILSFAPGRLQVPPGVRVRRVDLAMELEWLSYHITSVK